MTNIKFIASQAKTINLYKNTRSKLLKCCLYIFVEGPDDDSNGIETCRPSPINNILMIVCLTEQYCIFCIRTYLWSFHTLNLMMEAEQISETRAFNQILMWLIT